VVNPKEKGEKDEHHGTAKSGKGKGALKAVGETNICLLSAEAPAGSANDSSPHPKK